MTNERRVWKYQLEFGQQHVTMRAGAELCDVGLDGEGRPCVWALSDPQAPEAQRRLYVAATGQQVDLDAATLYVGSFTAGRLVGHLFDSGEVPPC